MAAAAARRAQTLRRMVPSAGFVLWRTACDAAGYAWEEACKGAAVEREVGEVEDACAGRSNTVEVAWVPCLAKETKIRCIVPPSAAMTDQRMLW